MNKKAKKIIGIIVIVFVVLMIPVGIFGYQYYKMIFSPNIIVQNADFKYLYIPTGAKFQTVLDSLAKNELLADSLSFIKIAKIKKYPEKVKSGKYKLTNNMSNNDLINILRSGRQTAVKLTFNNVRTKSELASKISKQIEIDSISLLEFLNNKNIQSKYNFNSETFLCMFLPNTYEVYWNISAEKFLDKMFAEYKNFWNEERLNKSKLINLSPLEVSILGSIVQAEQSAHNDEKAIVAGLYINRLKIGMLLQSDPTLVFALGDFSRKRILNQDKEVQSPYNTYKYVGLPPGPINLPEISTLEAVLNYKKTDYIFMCAKEDFSGYHNFSTNVNQHGIFARKYQEALNKRKIYK